MARGPLQSAVLSLGFLLGMNFPCPGQEKIPAPKSEQGVEKIPAPKSEGTKEETKEQANPELDKQIYNSLHDIINHGADLYNLQEDYSGCYRVYEGALLGLRPVLSHRPQLQKAITAGIEEANEEPRLWRRAFLLRRVIDEIRLDIRKDIGPPPANTTSEKPG
jgi:hypothetical protein